MSEVPEECPLCHCTDVYLFHDRVWQMQAGKVLRCRACEAAFLDPPMDSKQEKAFYSAYNDHVKKRGVTVSGTPEELHARSKSVAQERLDILWKYFLEKGNVLEVGAAAGTFLSLLPPENCACVEPDPANRQFADRFARQSYGDIAEIPSGCKFDTICMFHVFEHFRKPISFLCQCLKLQPPGGRVIVEVPFIEDPLLTIYDLAEFKDFYFQPMHPFVYSLKALRYCFQEAGYKEEEVIYHQRYGLDNHLSWLTNRRAGGDPRLSELFGKNVEYCNQLIQKKTTDTIYYIANAGG